MNSYRLIKKMQMFRVWYSLSAIEQALYYELISICNAKGWNEVFYCFNAILYQALEISDKTMTKARARLVEVRLISYRPGKTKRQAGCYSLCMDLANKTELPENVEETFIEDPPHRVDPAEKELPVEPELFCREEEDMEPEKPESITGANTGIITGVITGVINGITPDYIKTKTKTKKLKQKVCVMDRFEEFRKVYSGMKRGQATEFVNFRKKHRDYSQVVDLLLPALEAFRQWREQRIHRGEFVPQAPDMEQAVLGALLVEPTAFGIVEKLLHPDALKKATARAAHMQQLYGWSGNYGGHLFSPLERGRGVLNRAKAMTHPYPLSRGEPAHFVSFFLPDLQSGETVTFHFSFFVSNFNKACRS